MKEDTTMVLLGGMMCDERLWARQRSHLSDRATSVIVGDLTRSSSIEGMAGDVLAAAPERFALAGFSMGGIVAFEMWRQAPASISHLALFDTNVAPETPERKASRQTEIEAAFGGRLEEMIIEEFKPNYLAARSRENAVLRKTILDMALDLGAHVFERQSLALRDRPDSRSTLATITCETLVVCGREDALCPPHAHEYIAASIPQAELTILDDCGHMAPLERPRAVSRLLFELLRGRDQPKEIPG